MKKTVALGLGLLGLACGAPTEQAPLDDNGGAAGVAGGPSTPPLGRPRCQAPQGTTASPGTIEEAVQLLNALPKPTTVACFVESLARPLTIYATSSPFSAQPALSTNSPRVFIKLNALWVSIAIDGDSSYLLEFGHLIPSPTLRSVKAELHFPLTDFVAPSAPYDRVHNPSPVTGSVCGLCHIGERREPSITFAEAYSSTAFRPRPETRVAIETLQTQAQACDFSGSAHRCEMLSAVFDGGPVVEAPFPDSMATFF